MEAVLDMNGNRIINLPSPVGPNDAARLQDITDAITGDLDLTGYAELDGADFVGPVTISGPANALDISWAGDGTGATVYAGQGQSVTLGSNIHVAPDNQILAAATSGSRIAHRADRFVFDTFDGATVGTAPTFTTRLDWDITDNTWQFGGPIQLAGDGASPLAPVSRQQLDAAIIGAGAGSVTSVNSLTGTVVLRPADLSLASGANFDNTITFNRSQSNNEGYGLNIINTATYGGPDQAATLTLKPHPDGDTARISGWGPTSTSTGLRFITSTSGSGNVVLSLNPDTTATFANRVSGADPTTATNFVTKQWGEANLGQSPSGFFTAQRSGGTIDLTGYAGKTVKITTGVSGDNNIWEIVGLLPGQRAICKVDSNFAFLTTPPGFYAGSCVINGNWLPDSMGHPDLSVNAKDTVEILCTATNTYEVSLAQNQMFGRSSWAGSNREPQETYATIGYVGPYDATHGLPFGDFVAPIHGTAGKPTTKGLICRGVGDTAIIKMETYDCADGAGGDGVPFTANSFAKAWNDPKRMNQRICFGTGFDDGTARPSFNFTMPVGFAGPGSLSQGEHAAVSFFCTAKPTAASTPGGVMITATRPGTPTPIGVATAGADGGFWVYGKSALEAGSLGSASSAAALATLGSGLTLSNINQWHTPSLLVNNHSNGYANINIPMSPAESTLCDNYAGIAMRHYNDLTSGSDFMYRSDEGIVWWSSVASNSRSRVVGTKATDPGVLYHGGMGKSQSIYRAITDDQSFKWTLGSNQAGRAMITLEDGGWLDIAFSTTTTAINKTSTGSAFFAVASGTASAASGTDGNVTVYCDSTGISISNRRGSTQNFRIKFDYA